MSRKKHHRGQKHRHNGHDYGGRYDCNRHYNNCYGKDGRKAAASERRNGGKNEIRKELEDQ